MPPRQLVHSFRFFLFCAVVLALTGRALADDAGVLDIAKYGAKPDDGSDSTPAVRAALAEAKSSGAKTLKFSPGRYDFWPDQAEEKYYFITNNDPGMKRIEFPLDQFSDFTVDGGGAHFVFHGPICPFILDHAKNITLKNFSIDYQRPFDSEAKILKVTPDGADLEFSDEFPYKIEKDILVFIDKEKTPNLYPVDSLLEFDATKRETAYQVVDQRGTSAYIATKIGPGQVHLKYPGFQGTPGNIIVFACGNRLYPGITISDSDNTTLDHVTVYHAGAMAVVAQRSRDVTLTHVSVMPPPSNKRVISSCADATHFDNCLGQITMSDCIFENQEDDATNIHGIYVRISKQISPTEIEVQLVHPQQKGFDFIVPGEKLELVHGPSLVTFGQAVAKSVERENSEYSLVTVNDPLPPLIVGKDIIASMDGYPDVLIQRCFIGKNRARGLLLASRGKIVVEDNTFHTPGAAILFEGDGSHWFEQAGVRDCTIRNNHFDNCNYGTWGNAAIQVGAGIIPSERANSRYNKNITIENNTFDVFDPRILHLYSVDGLVFKDNKINHSTAYPAINSDAKPFDVTFSDHIDIRP